MQWGFYHGLLGQGHRDVALKVHEAFTSWREVSLG